MTKYKLHAFGKIRNKLIKENRPVSKRTILGVSQDAWKMHRNRLINPSYITNQPEHFRIGFFVLPLYCLTVHGRECYKQAKEAYILQSPGGE